MRYRNPVVKHLYALAEYCDDLHEYLNEVTLVGGRFVCDQYVSGPAMELMRMALDVPAFHKGYDLTKKDQMTELTKLIEAYMEVELHELDRYLAQGGRLSKSMMCMTGVLPSELDYLATAVAVWMDVHEFRTTE